MPPYHAIPTSVDSRSRHTSRPSISTLQYSPRAYLTPSSTGPTWDSDALTQLPHLEPFSSLSLLPHTPIPNQCAQLI